jgi:hypothetical protein
VPADVLLSNDLSATDGSGCAAEGVRRDLLPGEDLEAAFVRWALAEIEPGLDASLRSLPKPDLHRLLEFLLHRRIHGATDEQRVEWALFALEAGLDTSNLRILAGLTKPLDPWEVERYFARTLADLKLELPSQLEFLRRHVCQVARDIVTGAIWPAAGCKTMINLWSDLGEDPEQYYIWSDLDDGYWHDQGLTDVEVDLAIVLEAQALLASALCTEAQ